MAWTLPDRIGTRQAEAGRRARRAWPDPDAILARVSATAKGLFTA